MKQLGIIPFIDTTTDPVLESSIQWLQTSSYLFFNQ